MKTTGLSRLIAGLKSAPEPESGRDDGPSLTESSELELEKRWLQLVRVDAEQFRVFYDKYHDPLYRFMALRTGDEDAAQDLTQEVFIYALGHLDRFTWQGYSFGAWLFHIARRRVLPRHRRAGRRKSEDAFLRRVPPEGPAADAADGLERTELKAKVRSLLLRFPDDRHDAFVLHVFMELSVKDTALALGLPCDTVRSHLRRGRLKLVEWLRDEQSLTVEERRRVNEELAREQGLVLVPGLRRRLPLRDLGTGVSSPTPGSGEDGVPDD